jgi:BTB/POZ domain/MATH domain
VNALMTSSTTDDRQAEVKLLPVTVHRGVRGCRMSTSLPSFSTQDLRRLLRKSFLQSPASATTSISVIIMASQDGLNKRRKIVGKTLVGEPRKVSSGRFETLIFEFADFSSRSEKRGESVFTEPLSAHGYKWRLQLFPRGDNQSKKDAEFVSVYLNLVSPGPVSASFTICCGKKKSSISKPNVFKDGSKSWGYADWIRRSDFIDDKNDYVDENGTATILVDIDVYVNAGKVWYPASKELDQDFSSLLQCKSSKDVSFTVESSEVRAHAVVLELRAFALFEIVKMRKGNSSIDIPNMKSSTFERIIQHVYGALNLDRISDELDLEGMKELLVAADRFGCTHLKLVVESKLTESFLDVSTTATLLLFADGHSCALLKEAAMNIYIKDPEAVKKTNDWKLVVESTPLLLELLDAATLGTGGPPLDKKKAFTTEEVALLDVTSLRERLEAANLDLDESRETLVKRLSQHIA